MPAPERASFQARRRLSWLSRNDGLRGDGGAGGKGGCAPASVQAQAIVEKLPLAVMPVAFSTWLEYQARCRRPLPSCAMAGAELHGGPPRVSSLPKGSGAGSEPGLSAPHQAACRASCPSTYRAGEAPSPITAGVFCHAPWLYCWSSTSPLFCGAYARKKLPAAFTASARGEVAPSAAPGLGMQPLATGGGVRPACQVV